MADRTRARSRNDSDADQPLMHAVDAAQLAPKYMTAVIDRQPRQITGVEPTDEGGWIVEAEVVEDRRIPSTADILALYEIELDADGELLAYRRTRRYMRGQRWLPVQDAEPTVTATGSADARWLNGDTNGESPQ
jgi:hypothetical protein